AGSTSCWRASSRRGGSSCGVGVSKTTGILDVTSHLKAPESEPTSTSGNRSARLVAHMPILDLDSHRLHYLDEGRGLPVLLFHAYPLSAELRSEEHTSELQSRENLVCRLLLEKKKYS